MKGRVSPKGDVRAPFISYVRHAIRKHGHAPACGMIAFGVERDVLLADPGEDWDAFVNRVTDAAQEVGSFAAAVARQWEGNDYATLLFGYADGRSFTVHIPIAAELSS